MDGSNRLTALATLIIKVEFGLDYEKLLNRRSPQAILVARMEDWEFSSFQDYAGFRNGDLCNQELAKELLDISEDSFYNESYQVIRDDKIAKLF